MQYWLEHHARFTRHALQWCYSSCNYSTVCLATAQLSCSSTYSESGIVQHQEHSKFLQIVSETLCTFFAVFDQTVCVKVKTRLCILCVSLADMQMFDMLEKERDTLYLHLLMTMVCNVVFTASSTDTNDNDSMCIANKTEKWL